ncbi:hypothetical protein COBT_003071, partial [Conglomerata obtusa]
LNFKMALNELEDTEIERIYINLDAEHKKILVKLLEDENTNMMLILSTLNNEYTNIKDSMYILMEALWDVVPEFAQNNLAEFFDIMSNESL